MTRDISGFTLIEVIVAAGLLLAVSVGAAHLFGFTVAQNHVARQQLVMGLLAAAKLDELSAGIASGVVGSAAQVRDRLMALADEMQVDEVVIVTWTWDPAAQRRSYELLADAFGLA